MPNTREIITNKIQEIVSLYALQDEYKEKSHAILGEIKRLILIYEKGPDDSILEECRRLEEKHEELSLEYKDRVQNRSIGSFSYKY